LQQYRRKQQTPVVAVRLELETDGFTYQKWDGAQRCKRVILRMRLFGPSRLNIRVPSNKGRFNGLQCRRLSRLQ
jgi:hypothetical protein